MIGSVLRREDGWAVVPVMAVMGVVLTLGILALASVDSLQRTTGRERVRETAFTVAETVLNAEVRALTTRWPSTPGGALPAQCTQTVAPLGCAQPAPIAQFFAGNAQAAGATWKVSVRDNLIATPTHYDPALLETTPCGAAPPCTWDANRDGQLWVRAEAEINGERRVLVGLAKQQVVRIPLPRKVVVAGHFDTNNNGLKTIVDTRGCATGVVPAASCNTAQPAPVAVRCKTAAPRIGDPCLSFRDGQISPEVTEHYPDNVISPRALELLRARAGQLGTYFTSCPTLAQLTGPLVMIEGVNCAYVTGQANSPDAPGNLVVSKGTLELGGNLAYYGAIIATNGLTTGAAANLVSLTGNSYVQGAIFVEGDGGLVTGASKLNLSFDARALNQLTGANATTVAAGTFREVTPGV